MGELPAVTEKWLLRALFWTLMMWGGGDSQDPRYRHDKFRHEAAGDALWHEMHPLSTTDR